MTGDGAPGSEFPLCLPWDGEGDTLDEPADGKSG